MVALTVYVEGGVLPHPNIDPLTLDNSDRLRRSFHTFFSKLLSPQDTIDIKVLPDAGDKQSAKFLLEHSSIATDTNVVLFVDLDKAPDKRGDRIAELGLNEVSEQVYFMVQEMEAWFIAQPEIFTSFADTEGYERKKPDAKIPNNSLLKNKHPETIEEPSAKLDTIFGQHFAIQKKAGGKLKPASYKKLKHSSLLLELLDAPKLSPIFSDVKRFQEYLGTLNKPTQ